MIFIEGLEMERSIKEFHPDQKVENKAHNFAFGKIL
jgi:hypothetical protein